MDKIKSNQTKQLNEIMSDSTCAQIALIQHCAQLSVMLVNQLLENQVTEFAGERYSHSSNGFKSVVRHGHNPGSVKIQEKKYPIQIPRVLDRDRGECISLPILDDIKKSKGPNELLMKRLILGISTRDYEKVIQEAGEGFGVSKSSISKQFIQETIGEIARFRNRSLKEEKYIAIFLDGKYLRKDQVIIVMGITENGEKQILDFVQANSENEKSVRQLLVHLNHRGLRYTDGLLFIIDGSKGFRAAIETVYGHKAVIQRCTWHKRENVVSYLNEELKIEFRSKLNACYNEPNYTKARQGLLDIKAELEIINPSAARSLEEGFDETLTLQKLKVHSHLKRSLTTTNCIENLNNLLKKRIGKIKYWVNGKQIQRWTIMSLLDIEKRLKKIHNYKKLSLLRNKLKEITKTKKTYRLLLTENPQWMETSASKISTKNWT